MRNKWKRWVKRWRYMHLAERVITGLVALSVFLVLVFVLGGWLFKEPFRDWRRDQALAQAKEYIEQEDYRNALLALKRATVLTPGDITTWTVVADHLDRLGAAESLMARENLVRLAPENQQQRLALVKDALRYDNLKLAADTLGSEATTMVDGEEYHRLAATLALSMRRDADYQRHLEAILAMKPNDVLVRFNLAVIRIQSDEAEIRRAAMAELEQLLGAPEVRVRVAVQLLKDAANRQDAASATNAALAIERAFPLPPGMSELPAGWPRLRTKLLFAATEVNDVLILAEWLATIGNAREALSWIDGLSETIREDPRVKEMTVVLSASSDDLPRLAELLRQGIWGRVDEKFLTALLQAREQNLRAGSEARGLWLEAFAAAQDSKPDLQILVRLTMIWRLNGETERALNMLTRLAPRNRWAYDLLAADLRKRGQSLKLWDLLSRRRGEFPQDVTTEAHWLILGAVLDQLPADVSSQLKSFEERAPEIPLVAAAKVAVLWRQQQLAEARALVMQHRDWVKTEPLLAFWSEVLGSEIGVPDPRRRKLLLERVWLPEEWALVQAALPEAYK